jgi:hypothetical protein
MLHRVLAGSEMDRTSPAAIAGLPNGVGRPASRVSTILHGVIPTNSKGVVVTAAFRDKVASGRLRSCSLSRSDGAQ